jgi:hypothetical protein
MSFQASTGNTAEQYIKGLTRHAGLLTAAEIETALEDTEDFFDIPATSIF